MSGNKISLSLAASRKAPPPSNGVKRSRAALHDDPDDDVESGKPEPVSHFDKAAGGAIDEANKREDIGPLVIAPQANRDWREKATQRKRQKSGLPAGPGNSAELDARMKDVEAEVEASKPKFGLNTYKKASVEHGDSDVEMTNGDAEIRGHEDAEGEAEAAPHKTDDQLAMDALLGNTATDRTLTIAASEAPMTESDAFRHDFRASPAMATLDDYERVPVEQFGAALLRGMGWKDGEGIGRQKGKKLPKEIGQIPGRKANLLGIGAKEDAAIAQEMGAWGRAAKGKDAKIYNPLLLRNKKTGEKYTEEELEKKKKQDDERRKYEMEFDRKEKDRERKRRHDGDYDSRGRRREKDRDSSRDRRQRGDHDRDDRRDRTREHRKSDSEDGDEHSRRKEKERRRRREREADDYDRHRSRRQHREQDDRDRDRYRDRTRGDRAIDRRR